MFALITCVCFSFPRFVAATPKSVPITTHPRIWLTSSYVTQLRSWATASNPAYVSLSALASSLKGLMDNASHTIPNQDGGSVAWEEYPTEAVAQYFAFMSLISQTQTARDDYAQRARTLLMYIMDRAVLGVGNAPFRYSGFSTRDRSRWWGSSFGTTIDWIYPSLSAADKTKIRTVFLRWIDENLHATTDYLDHPSPIGVVNNPILYQNIAQAREANNNYFDAHARNITLMAMSFDAADDPGGTLTGYIGNAIGAWLYMIDHLLRTDMVGGLPAEGFEYGPQAIGYISQLMLALHTSGQDDPAVWGSQVSFNGSGFFSASIPAYLHSLSPKTITIPGEGPAYSTASYGDSSAAYNPDWMDYFGPLGIHAYLNNDSSKLDQIRWIQLNTPPGGVASLQDRIDDDQNMLSAIFYFMLFSPSVGTPADPRPQLSNTYYAPGLSRLFERSDWTQNAAWFNYNLSWSTIGHQHAGGNGIGFYRKGEWLTRIRDGYGYGYAASDHQNTLALLNDQPSSSNEIPTIMWQHGSQWILSDQNAPPPIYSVQPNYTFVRGNATKLYNSPDDHATDILHASRDIMWLKPDFMIIYDRATSKTAGRWKRFWLNLPMAGTVSGNLTTSTLSGGQRFYVRTLLPVGASPVVALAPSDVDDLADYDPMPYRLKVEAPGNPQNARFLHVLQGADTGIAATASTLVQSNGNTFTGTTFNNTVVMFSTDMTQTFSPIVYQVPNAVTQHFITGLTPGAKYNAAIVPSGSQTQLTLTAGTTYTADGAGVVFINTTNVTVTDTIGVYKNGVFYLRNSNTAGAADIQVNFGGDASDLPVAGDWNGDGRDTIGVMRASTGVFFLSDSNTAPTATYSLVFGNPGDTPFAGRWTVDMTHDGLGVYRPTNGILYEKKQLTTGFSDFFAIFGNPGDQGVGGDWDGNGMDSIGIYRPSNQTWFMTNNGQPSGITFSDVNFVWNMGTAIAVVGDWDGNGTTTIGAFTSAGAFTLHPANTTSGTDTTFNFGPTGGTPIAGKWNGSAAPVLHPFAPVGILVTENSSVEEGDAGGGRAD